MKGLTLLVALTCLAPGLVFAEELKAGIIYPLTGNASLYGRWAEKGVELAFEEHNKSHSPPLRAIYEDSKGQPAGAVAAYQKLRTIDGVNFVSTVMSSPALAVSPLVNKDRVILIDASATSPDYSSPNDFTFRTGAVGTQLAAAEAKVLHDILGVKKCNVIVIENEFGEGMLKVFKEAYAGEIASVQYIMQEGADFRPQLLNIKRSGILDVWAVGHMAEMGLLMRQAREADVALRVVTDVYGVEGNTFLTAAQGTGEGVLYLGPKFDASGGNAAAARFSEQYRERYGEEPSYYAAQGYDAAALIAEAIGACGGDRDTECARRFLNSVDREGASGRLKFDVNGDVTKDLVLKTVKEGKFVVLQDVRS